MVLLFALASLLLFGASSSRDLINIPSYCELAAASLPAQFQIAVSLLKVDGRTKPDDVAVLRKSLLHVRDLVDVFSFAYPNTTNVTASTPVLKPAAAGGSRSNDPLLLLRDDLDAGYTVLGDFQDLAHR